ncbi:hypothetical protein Clacol_001197 [Clathrus columnatus]|uniref:Peptidase A1 domain-containing protein n=1 Tax=Clathrus columnatus TaxID=1419009 RepID=A0AAV5A2M7_9AGAM|nr:hypothetical protein Clacol_001197 [Clathrus columnatus]
MSLVMAAEAVARSTHTALTSRPTSRNVRTQLADVNPGHRIVSRDELSSDEHLVLESVTLAPGFTLANQSVGVISATSPDVASGTDGILAVGPKNLTRAQFLKADNRTTPTIADTAFDQGLVPQDLFGISINLPVNEDNPGDFEAIGELHLGGVSPDLFCGDMTFIPTVPAANAWSVGSASLSIGGSSLSTNSTILFDTGASVIFLPNDQFEHYQNVTGGTLDEFGTLHFTLSEFVNLPPLVIDINGVSFSLPALAQAGQASPDDFVSFVSSLGALQVNVTETIMGIPFFLGFYMAFDNTRNEIGIAKSINSVEGCSP